MRSHQTSGLEESRFRRVHEHGHQEHAVRQELDSEGDDVERHHGLGAFLSVQIRQSED